MQKVVPIAAALALGLSGVVLAQERESEGLEVGDELYESEEGFAAQEEATEEPVDAEGNAIEKCVESPWGPDDEIGALNRITNEKTLEAAKLVKQGKAIRLGIEINKDTPSFPPRVWSLHTFLPSQEGGRAYGKNRFNYIDDVVMGWVGTGPQIDGLGHGGIDNMYYNCTPVEEFLQADGITKFGIQNVPAVATRGVILDMAGLHGENPVPEGTVFNRAEIDAALERQGVSIEEGDVVIFYTGWTDLIGVDDERYASGEPGLGIEGAEYLASLGVAMVGADTWGLE